MKQDIIVFGILASALGWIVYMFYSRFFVKKNSPCSGCKGCEAHSRFSEVRVCK